MTRVVVVVVVVAGHRPLAVEAVRVAPSSAWAVILPLRCPYGVWGELFVCLPIRTSMRECFFVGCDTRPGAVMFRESPFLSFCLLALPFSRILVLGS